jgi:alkanesulfonate monooxygenase SsuD/methylene tetrahydromethanopterin reductase-like flavin-dependent oxidoreductase (luciferase family)
MFRASNDGGETFGDKINLSNSSEADSGRVEIAAEGADVIVTWWERNQTSDTPVARISTDAGETFGELIMLGTNGTIGVTEEDEGGETVEEAVAEAAAGEGGG